MAIVLESYVVDSGFGFVRTLEQTARKKYVCDFCGGPIHPGSTYKRTTEFVNDHFFTFVFHEWGCADPRTNND